MSTDLSNTLYLVHLEASDISTGNKFQELQHHIHHQFVSCQGVLSQEEESLGDYDMIIFYLPPSNHLITWLGSTTSGVMALNRTLLITPGIRVERDE